ncbi:bis(5'-nucleosyl)-tetraphosphatase [asymmetrical] [Lepeophtheirus salmonis]|uniref:bis(5'-nucleosyl)-tetraphosphatase [asymmetrical] n=1 Tax=Lepeophtheirus salmonis TaxID=72036 RepID=UPI001AE951CD|nr:bis(5'-nucleosyl)-tetraphosphatase [asymmetrical]-like [Lepeophtheirus salmonis]
MTVVRASGFILFQRVSDSIEYLIMKASYGSKHWTPPKGHVDPGESILQTAIRETKEESGFEPEKDFIIIQNYEKVLKYNVKSHLDGIVRPKETIYFLGEMVPGEREVTLSEEHTDFKWVTLSTCSEYANFPDFILALTECEEFIKSLS